jgi:hypothetical protein
MRDGDLLGGQDGSEAVREKRLRFVQNILSRSSLDCERTSTNDRRRSSAPKPLEPDKTAQQPARHDCFQFCPDSIADCDGGRRLSRPSGFLVITRSCSAGSRRWSGRAGQVQVHAKNVATGQCRLVISEW